MFRIFKFMICIKNDNAHFFSIRYPGIYLIGLQRSEGADGYVPCFGGSDPVPYSRRSARFLASELRRCGYFVRSVPYVFYLIRLKLQSRKADPWKK